MNVFVLLFNAGTDNEGIHTLKVGDRNVVLMFEAEDDATRYGLMLEAQDFSSPKVETFEADEITEFCQGADYDYKLVPEGALAVPPETNLEQTDWQKDAPAQGRGEVGPGSSPAASEEDSEPASGLPYSELDRIRRQLEGLL